MKKTVLRYSRILKPIAFHEKVNKETIGLVVLGLTIKESSSFMDEVKEARGRQQDEPVTLSSTMTSINPP